MRIDDYVFGKIVIDGETYTSDVIVCPDRVISNWWREEGHELSVRDIHDVLRERPEILIVGTGSPGLMRVLPETRRKLEDEKIELIIKPTHEACAVFNELVSTRKTVACLHLTC